MEEALRWEENSSQGDWEWQTVLPGPPPSPPTPPAQHPWTMCLNQGNGSSLLTRPGLSVGFGPHGNLS